ncbi:MAG: hypothetical protein LUH20_11240 [Lachnospiraceae bacterium]|nr:hypothetical protein [Lachnospiraceae bacterium]
MAEKRQVKTDNQTGLKSINNLILVGIMMAVGVVLRLCASFLVLGNMHPNFLIATYCLSILIIKPNIREAAIIGFISGCISQIGTSMAWLGLISETVGAVAMCLLLANPMPKAPKALVNTFITTLISGFAFTGLAALTYANPMPMAQFMSMALVTVVTACLNCVIVTVLSIPVDKIINKE